MRWIKQFFYKAVKSAQDADEALDSCKLQSSNNDCSLIRQLKDKQLQKRAIDKKIKEFVNDEQSIMDNFIELLMLIEGNNFEMGGDRSSHHAWAHNSKLRFHLAHCEGVKRLMDVISQMPGESIDAIHNELKSIKNRATILGDLKRQSQALEIDIRQIKVQLGIE